MCRCNQGVVRPPNSNINLLNQARHFLSLARHEKQQGQLAQEFYEEGVANYLSGFALKHFVKAREARAKAKKALVIIEKRYGTAFSFRVTPLPVSARKLDGWRFHTWKEYRKIFGGDDHANVDTW